MLCAEGTHRRRPDALAEPVVSDRAGQQVHEVHATPEHGATDGAQAVDVHDSAPAACV